MSEKKEPIGFDTSASKLQKGFDEISARLKKDKIGWVAITEAIISIEPTFSEVLGGILKDAEGEIHKEAEEAKGQNFQRQQLQRLLILLGVNVDFSTLRCVAELGIALADLHERVGNIEQSIAKLALRLK